MTIPRDPHEAAALVLHDFRRPGVFPDLTIVVAKWPIDPPPFLSHMRPIERPPLPRAGSAPPGFGEEDETVVLCSEEGRFLSLVHIPDLIAEHPLVIRLADTVHQAVLDDRWGGCFPQCPAHEAHPLFPQLRDDGVFWECPSEGIAPIPLGSLPDHFN